MSAKLLQRITYSGGGGVRGEYEQRYRAGTNLVLLEPDGAKMFRDEKAVDDALRLVIPETPAILPWAVSSVGRAADF